MKGCHFLVKWSLQPLKQKIPMTRSVELFSQTQAAVWTEVTSIVSSMSVLVWGRSLRDNAGQLEFIPRVPSCFHVSAEGFGGQIKSPCVAIRSGKTNNCSAVERSFLTSDPSRAPRHGKRCDKESGWTAITARPAYRRHKPDPLTNHAANTL